MKKIKLSEVHFPADPLQPGPIYFLTARKCGLFGVCSEGIPSQINYLIDEGMAASKGSLTVVNYIDHFYQNYGLGETELQLHCDNCTGQNKNRFMLYYLAWRTIKHLHDKISLSFLITGHTKFVPDWCFGLIKQPYRCTKVNTLDEISEVVNKSTVTGINQTQLVGKEDGTVYVYFKDWNKWLEQYFRPFQGIKSYQHFSSDAENPGVVMAKKFCDSDEVTKFQLLCNVDNIPPLECPYKVKPPGLDGTRQKYLFDNIRDFCDDDGKDVTCPKPKRTM